MVLGIGTAAGIQTWISYLSFVGTSLLSSLADGLFGFVFMVYLFAGKW